MRLEAIGPAGRCRGGVVSIYWFRRPRVTLLCQPYARAGPGRGRPAATGSLANAIGRAKTAEGLGRASLRHFGLARGCRRIWRGVIRIRFIGFAGAMRLEAIGPAGRCRGGVVRFIGFGGPAFTSFVSLTRARARPWSARCYGVARQRDRSRQNSRGARACFSPAFRARAWVPKNLARRNSRFIGFAGAMRLEAIGPAGRCRGGVVRIYWFRRPRVTSFVSLTRARARPWSARCYGVARQRDRSRQNRRGARACFSPAFRPRAWVPKNLARRNSVYWFRGDWFMVRRRDAARPDRAAC